MHICIFDSLSVMTSYMGVSLGGYAADVEAGSAERGVLLDADGLHAELGRLDGAHVAARTGADHHEVDVVARRVEAERRHGRVEQDLHKPQANC